MVSEMRNLTEEDITHAPDIGSDTVQCDGDDFYAQLHFYVRAHTSENKNLVAQEIEVSSKKGECLPPFRYTKPSGDPLSPNEIEEDVEREGYYPLTMIQDGYR